MKKMLCLIMSLIVIATFSISTNAVAFDDTDKLTVTGSHSEDDLFCDDFYYHILDDGTAEITEYVGEAADLYIPESLANHVVTSISIQYENSNVLSIHIGKYVSSFYYITCTSLENVFVDEQNEYFVSNQGIVYSSDMTELLYVPSMNKTTDLIIPNSVIKVSALPFSNYMKNLTIGKNVCQTQEFCYILTSVVFYNQMENIFVDGDNPYYKSVNGIVYWHDTETGIDKYAFPPSNRTTSFIVPEGQRFLGRNELQHCKYLEDLYLPNGLEWIGYEFTENASLKNIYVNSDNEDYCSIDGILYSKDMTELLWIPEMNPIEDYIIPETITEIKCTPFSRNMKNLRIHKGITQTNMDYELSCVYAYDNMENFIVDNDNPYYYSIGGILYWKKPDLYRETRFAYPPSNKSLSFKIPDKTTLYMDDLSLNHVKYLENLILPESMKTFSAQSVCLLKNLKSITVEEGNEYYTSIDGILYSQDMKRLICYPKGRIESSYTIPDGITTIERYALISTVNLKEIIFPESVIEINDFPGYETTMRIAMNLQKVDGFIIKGYRNTIAEIYAEENGFKFISIGDVERLLGDSDGDGNITILDATVIQRHLASIPTAVYIEAAADADQDGSVTIIDATCIQRWLAELPTHEGIGEIFV